MLSKVFALPLLFFPLEVLEDTCSYQTTFDQGENVNSMLGRGMSDKVTNQISVL